MTASGSISKNPQGRVDPAALGSAAVAAVITLSLSPGRYSWLSTGVGLALGLLVVAYYRPGHVPVNGPWDMAARAAAFGAVAGLLVAMIASWPIQLGVGTPEDCKDWDLRIDIDGCAGDEAGQWIAWTWLITGVALAIGHFLWIRRVHAPQAA